jgi:hypothetical protein
MSTTLREDYTQGAMSGIANFRLSLYVEKSSSSVSPVGWAAPAHLPTKKANAFGGHGVPTLGVFPTVT